VRFNGATGAFIDTFVPALSGGLMLPIGLAFGPDDNLYVSSFNDVLRYNGTTGAFMDAFIPGGTGGLDRPVYLAFTPAPAISEPTTLMLLAATTLAMFGVKFGRP
jgi:hypothetical protein